LGHAGFSLEPRLLSQSGLDRRLAFTASPAEQTRQAHLRGFHGRTVSAPAGHAAAKVESAGLGAKENPPIAAFFAGPPPLCAPAFKNLLTVRRLLDGGCAPEACSAHSRASGHPAGPVPCSESSWVTAARADKAFDFIRS